MAKASFLKLKWSLPTGGPIATSTSIVGTTAYIGSWDGYEYAVNTGTGAVIWKQYLGVNQTRCNPDNLGVTSAATVKNGVVYVGGGDPYWYALNVPPAQSCGGSTPATPPTRGALQLVEPARRQRRRVHRHREQLRQPARPGPAAQGRPHDAPGCRQRYNFVPDDQVGGGVWTTPTYDARTNTIFVSTGTLNDYTQTQSQAIVALNAGTLQTKSVWQLPFSAAVFDSDWGTAPTLTTEPNGQRLLLGRQQERHRLHLQPRQTWPPVRSGSSGSPSAATARRAGDGTIASGIFANGVLYYAGGHTCSTGTDSGGSISAFNPGTGMPLDAPDRGADLRGTGVRQRHDRGDGRLDVRGARRLERPPLVLVRPAEHRLRSGVGRPRPVLRRRLRRHALRVRLGSAPSAPPNDPNCPSGFSCQDVNPANGSEKTTSGALTVTAWGERSRGVPPTSSGSSPSRSPAIRSPACGSPRKPQNTQPQAGLMVRSSTATEHRPDAPYYAVLAYPERAAGRPQPKIVIWYRTEFGRTPCTRNPWSRPRPISVMVQRKGDFFSAGISFDGVNFQLIPGTTVRMTSRRHRQGIAVNSGGTNNYGTASFSGLAVGGPSTRR